MSFARALSAADAFLIACLPGALGPPLCNQAIGDAISQTRIDEELAQAVRRASQAIEISRLQADNAHKILVEKTAQNGLFLPERPTTAQGFETWLQTMRAILRQAIKQQKEDAALLAFFDAGCAAGELHLCLWVGRNTLYLRTAAPKHKMLGQAAENIARTLLRAKERLVAALQKTAFPQSAAAIAQKLDAMFKDPPKLDSDATATAFKAYDEWAQEVATLIEQLGELLIK